jgi:pimeloyl-ACP methyl ester carboxylesterase
MIERPVEQRRLSPPSPWASAVLMVPLLVIFACGGSTSTAPPTLAAPGLGQGIPAGPTGDAFYKPPAPLQPAAPGKLIWASQADGPEGMRLFKVLYHSHSAKDADIAVSGLVFVPSGPAPVAGWPILAYAHGTDGLGPQCAPSKTNGKDEAALVAARLVPMGFVVAATDYEGLGTPGVHTYVVGLSEGRTVLDSIRAARQLTGDRQGKSVVLGHSQGGGAALFAAELAPTYAPDAGVVGSVAGAPAVELKLLASALRTSPFFGYVLMAAAGFHAAYPEFDLSRVLTAKGIAVSEDAAKACNEIVDKLKGANPDDYLKADPATVEPAATLLEQNSPGNIPTPIPIFVYQGEQDEQIPVVASLLLLRRMCRVGGFTVLRTTYPGASHVGVIEVAAKDIQGWIGDRLAGKPAPTTPCPPPT